MSDTKIPTARPSIITEVEGDLFGAPENAVLIHACNCVGSWGAGIAKAFQSKYPAAYKAHRKFCRDTSIEDLIGTCQLIAPQEDDYKEPVLSPNPRPKRRRMESAPAEEDQRQTKKPRKHWIACLFTSKGYGKATKTRPGKDSPDVILNNTTKSLVDFREQLQALWPKDDKGTLDEGKSVGSSPGELWSCKFNSGLFAVEWDDTKKALEQEMGALNRPIKVMSPAES